MIAIQRLRDMHLPGRRRTGREPATRAIVFAAVFLLMAAYPPGSASSQPADGPRVELVFQIDWRAELAQQLEDTWEALRLDLQNEGVAYSVVSMGGASLTLATDDPDALSRIEELAGALEPMMTVQASGSEISVRASQTALSAARDGAVRETMAVLQRRLEQSYVPEPVVEHHRPDRIRIVYPTDGADYPTYRADPATLIPLLLRRGELAFRFVVQPDAASPRGQPVAETIVSADGESWLVEREPLLTNAHVEHAETMLTQGQIVLQVRFTPEGSEILAEATARSVGRPLAIVVDGEVLSAPVIRAPISGGAARIEGGFTMDEASEIATALMSGALPAPLALISQHVVP